MMSRCLRKEEEPLSRTWISPAHHTHIPIDKEKVAMVPKSAAATKLKIAFFVFCCFAAT
jgi:hypothetical protein